MQLQTARPAATPIAPPSGARLAVPDDVTQELHSSVGTATQSLARFRSEHPDASTGDLRRFLREEVVGKPPSAADAVDADIRRVADANAGRNDAVDGALKFYEDHGTKDLWRGVLDELGTAKGADRAKAAEAVLDDALRGTQLLVGEMKVAEARPRPYLSSDDINPLFERTFDGRMSYPSGHTAKSYTYATVLGAFWPERAAELRETAEKVAYSRMVAGFHHPTDLQAGAKIGAAMALDALDRARIDG